MILTIDDLFTGWRCLRRLEDRISVRGGDTSSLTCSDILDFPSGSANTHQFLEKYRVHDSVYRDYLSRMPGCSDIGSNPLLCHFSGDTRSLDQHDSITRPVLTALAAENASSDGEMILAAANGLFVSSGRVYTMDLLRRMPGGELRLSLLKASTKIKDGYLRELSWTLGGLAELGIYPEELSIFILGKNGGESGELLIEKRQKRRHSYIKTSVFNEVESMERRLAAGNLPTCRSGSCEVCNPQVSAGGAEATRAKDSNGAAVHKTDVGGAHGSSEVGGSAIRTLHRSGGLAEKLAAEGISSVRELHKVSPALKKKLKAHHWIQHRAEVERREQVDAEKLSAYLDSLVYPLHFLDFECFLEALPTWTGVKIWEHAPFLFSAYSMDRDAEVVHSGDFLIDDGVDRREEMADALIELLAGEGSILVYGVHFEEAVIRRLSQAVPSRRTELEAIIARLSDLQIPFADFAYYHPGQSGKISLKTVLPILTSQRYDAEAVRDGADAFIGYYYLMHPEILVPESWDPYAAEVRSNPERFFADVVEYCRTDTRGLAYLVRALEAKRL